VGPAASGVRRILLTASGGPFRSLDLAAMADVSPDDACAHPNWRMGRKISVDSATMMNKGLELIEAHHLFGLPSERLDVVVHPQSVIHSLVEYLDGSMLAQLGNPDMRTPIAHALAYPERVDSGVSSLELARLGRLDFEEPDPRRFPCLRLAREALEAHSGAACVLNAANEVAVAAFLDRRIGFTRIAEVVDATLQRMAAAPAPDAIDAAIELDRSARLRAEALLAA
jgi:1-deoxy-D-xylulose-5-phosphate reductoisomerase